MHPTSWAEWGHMYVNLDLWEPLIEEVLKLESIRYKEISLTKHPGTHAVFQIDDRYILKFYTPLSPDHFHVQKEKEVMASTLAENLKKYHATKWNREEIPEWSIDSINHLTRLKEKLQGVRHPSLNLAYSVVLADMHRGSCFLTNKKSWWILTGMIDVADSKCSSVLLEFPAIWFELFKGDVGLMRVFFKTYDATIPFNDKTRLTLTYYTLIHQFGVNMIEQACERQEINKVDSFQDLVEVMWPEVLFSPSP
jgi:hypothetical protein